MQFSSEVRGVADISANTSSLSGVQYNARAVKGNSGDALRAMDEAVTHMLPVHPYITYLISVLTIGVMVGKQCHCDISP